MEGVVCVTRDRVGKEPCQGPAHILKEGMLTCDGECRSKAIGVPEAGSLVTANTHCDGSTSMATLADVFGAKKNMVRRIGSRVGTIGDAARKEVWKYLAKAARSGDNQAVEPLPEDAYGTATFMCLIWESQRVEGLVQAPCFGSRGWASVSQDIQKVAVEAAGWRGVGVWIGSTC